MSYEEDLKTHKEKLEPSDLDLIFKDLKVLFKKKGYLINWKSLEQQDLNETLNTLAMISPFSLEEKQILLETESLDIRRKKITEILNNYTFDNFNNSTMQ
jgi:Lon protease-like protein